jgi:hypothetical protein
MSAVIHRAIVVTSFDKTKLRAAHSVACAMFGGRVSVPLPSEVNGYESFLVGTCGSKIGWEPEKRDELVRAAFIGHLRSYAYEDGSNSVEWAEIEYGNSATAPDTAKGSRDSQS